MALSLPEREADQPPGWRALDGDTVATPAGERVRLLGVDTPEQGRPGAARATVFTSRWMARVGPEDPSPTAPRDAYGRLLVDLEGGGERLAEALLAAGRAWAYRTRDPRLLAAQAGAVGVRRGVHREVGRGPWVVGRGVFHAPDCRYGPRPAAAVAATAEPLLKAGSSPCRICLRWPPRPLPLSWPWWRPPDADPDRGPGNARPRR